MGRRRENRRLPDGADRPVALDELFEDAYDRLHNLAEAERARWRGNETLNTTALVHEVYVKLAHQRSELRNPDRLLAVAARAMRHVLVNYAEEQAAAKRGGGLARVTLATVVSVDDSPLALPPGRSCWRSTRHWIASRS